jgi:hypothetical protein
VIEKVNDDDRIQINTHHAVFLMASGNGMDALSYARSSSLRKSSCSVSISSLDRNDRPEASPSARTRCKYSHQFSSTGAAKDRSTTSTGPDGRFGKLANSSDPSGLSVPRRTCVAPIMFAKSSRKSFRQTS